MRTQKQTSDYYARKQNGLCVSCGQPSRPGLVRCTECSVRERDKYRQKRARSQCSSCGRVTRCGYAQCHKCRDVIRLSSLRRGREKRETGTCMACNQPAEQGRRYCVACSAARRLKRSDAVAAGLCEMCRKQQATEHQMCAACRARKLTRARMLKAEVLKKYGGKCKCCGESEPVFLAIDHVNNEGAGHRRKDGRKIHAWLKRNGFPEGFQVLCHNCNWAKRFGPCPHTLRSKR